MHAKLFIAYIAASLLTRALAAGEPNYPPPGTPGDPTLLGKHIQRTMSLLETSTPEKRNPVKVLFYGQSITAGDWTQRVAQHLRDTYPHADLTIDNRAIGGFASQLLIRTAEHDLYPYYPDLLIFHVYGDHRRYEDIIRFTRERTTAEIAIYNDHSGAGQDDTPDFNDSDWTAFMDGHIRRVAAKYDCGLIDIHEPWKQYLRKHHYRAADLLTDGIHLNAHGGFVMAEFINQYLVRSSDDDPDPHNMVTTYEIGKDLTWQDGRLVLEFEGNRIDVVSARTENEHSTARVLIDGKWPSEFPELYVFTRTSRVHRTWPAIIRVERRAPLIVEQWRAEVYDAKDFAKTFKFDVYGSKTGFDGSGTSDGLFISRSGRIAIDPCDWHLHRTCSFKKKELPEDFETRWKVVPTFADTFTPRFIENPALQYRTTLAQGLSNSRHTLELVAEHGNSVPIKAIQVYRPPFGRE
jgi:hypothetical protein